MRVKCLPQEHNTMSWPGLEQDGSMRRRLSAVAMRPTRHPQKGQVTKNNSKQNQKLNFIFGISGTNRVISLILTILFLIAVCKRTKNRPFSYSRYWTGASLQVRLMRGSLFKCKLHSSLCNDIPPREPPLQASSSPIPRIRKWSIC